MEAEISAPNPPVTGASWLIYTDGKEHINGQPIQWDIYLLKMYYAHKNSPRFSDRGFNYFFVPRY